MGKNKRATLKKQGKKTLSKKQAFLLGILVGSGLLLLPFDLDFSPTELKQNPWPSQSVFDKHLPTTTPLIQRTSYTAAYNGQTRTAHWVYHKITPAILEKQTDRRECEFREDPLIPPSIQSQKKDYRGSGYDRGHLCPAADCTTQQDLESSFFLTNIAPQVPALNRGFWKRLETHVRDLTQQYRVVHIFSGPLYLSKQGANGKRYVRYEVIGKNEVAVPTHFFMIILVELPSNKILNKAYIVPNQAIDPKVPLRKYSVSIEEVERKSGVLFTHILP